MLQANSVLARLWRRIMLRRTAFSGAYGKLRALYAMEDPWEMESPREQHRFKASKGQLTEFSEKYGSILELGSGEGHQSLYLQTLTDHLFGVDISSKAVQRASQRCPDAKFVVAKMEEVDTVFSSESFELVCACEVLYYARDLPSVLEKIQARTKYLYVSNYAPRSEKMQGSFSGPGWSRLSDITYGSVTWNCYIWKKDSN